MANAPNRFTDLEFKDFPFKGLGSTGRCYIKVRHRPDDVVVFCAQLSPYRGASITNAVGSIFRALMSRLREDGVALPRRFDKVIQRVSWIKHYPRTSSLVYGDTHALVKFDCKLNPMWHYLTRERAAFTVNVPQSFLKVNKAACVSRP